MSRVTAPLSSGTVVEPTNGRHTWNASEPIEVRGTDTAPNPYELLLGSQAACTYITLALAAATKRSLMAWYSLTVRHSGRTLLQSSRNA